MIDGETVTMGIWVNTKLILKSKLTNITQQDTAGSERYESMSRIYYRGAKAAIVCYGKCFCIQCTMIYCNSLC